jgi:hypothetical protein
MNVKARGVHTEHMSDDDGVVMNCGSMRNRDSIETGKSENKKHEQTPLSEV